MRQCFLKNIKTSIQTLALLVLMLGGVLSIGAQSSDDIFTIYLVRHAEKLSDAPNPELTSCGEERAERLSSFFGDVSLGAVYSTDFKRTKSTALPTANAKGLEIQEYNPYELEEFKQHLLDSKEDVLVVGHSNTTGVLAGLLVGEEIGEFDLSIYNRVYQVVIAGDNGRLHVLHTSFTCSEE